MPNAPVETAARYRLCGTLRYRLLGPVEALREGEPCTPSAPKQRALLALLLLNANELVSTSRIVDELWGYLPPRSAVPALQMYVCALRRALAPGVGDDPRRHPVLRTLPSGYELLVRADQLDLADFRALASRGRAALAGRRCVLAGALFRRALALWRGPALVDLSRDGALDRYAARLDGERLTLLEARIGVDLCQGRGAEVVGELTELCDRFPLREEPHQQLMLALAVAGRRAEALDVYTRARAVMVAEAGIEPGPGLRAAQQALLAGRRPPNGAHDQH